jgi:uncharacterized protein (DUF1697 family)
MMVWVGLLRGVNVGGKHILPMKEFARELQNAGFDGVKTYIQSGNIVFRNDSDAPRLANRIGEIVHRSRGFKPSVFVLSADRLGTVVRRNPYPAAEQDPKSLHLFFLDGRPKKPDVKRLAEFKSPTESITVIGDVLYLCAPDGIGRSKLVTQVSKALRVDATARNWRTVSKLLELARGFT